MGKSLTALTVGRVHCSGLLPDLDRKAKSYDDRLAGTQYGEATVRQLLMMASGAARGSAKRGGSPLNPPAHLPNAFFGNPWYAGYADHLVANQTAAGTFSSVGTAINGTSDLATSWAIIILSPSLFELPPSASCSASPATIGTHGGSRKQGRGRRRFR